MGLKGLPNVVDIRCVGLTGAIDLAPIPGSLPGYRALDHSFFEAGIMLRPSGDTIGTHSPAHRERRSDRRNHGQDRGIDQSGGVRPGWGAKGRAGDASEPRRRRIHGTSFRSEGCACRRIVAPSGAARRRGRGPPLNPTDGDLGVLCYPRCSSLRRSGDRHDRVRGRRLAPGHRRQSRRQHLADGSARYGYAVGVAVGGPVIVGPDSSVLRKRTLLQLCAIFVVGHALLRSRRIMVG